MFNTEVLKMAEIKADQNLALKGKIFGDFLTFNPNLYCQ